MCLELEEANIPFRGEAMVPVHYKGRAIPLGFRSDIVVADSIIVEIKAVAAIVPAHETHHLETPNPIALSSQPALFRHPRGFPP